MSEQFPKEEILRIFKEIEQDPEATQRVLALKLGISLGKTNYILKELIKRGLVKVKHFTDNPGKLRKINYMLTKEGFERKIFLIKHFLEKKEAEFSILKREWEELLAKNEAKAEASS
jgi:EPS-associated MarR family transcriptional regulator